jgi:hypothetical protein
MNDETFDERLLEHMRALRAAGPRSRGTRLLPLRRPRNNAGTAVAARGFAREKVEQQR